MNLPDNPAERKKIFLAFGILGASVLYLAINYGVRPLLEKRKNRAEQITQLEELVFASERKIKKLDQYREELGEHHTAVLDVAELKQHVLHHNLGNLRLVAESIILPYFKQNGLKITQTNPNRWTQEVDTTINSEGIPKGRRFVPFGLSISGAGDFINLIHAIDELESSNPYLSVTSLTTEVTPGAPAEQTFQLLIEWPTWTTDEIKMAITLSAGDNS